MSTFICEPGSRLGGRYRLEDRVSTGTGWSAWKAIDETLARPVTVLTFAAGFPRIGEAVTAARAASRLTDARVAQVFDVEEDWDHAYVVMEWVSGDSLTDLLADGPLEPDLAAHLVAEAADAVASAHAAGVAHLCLTPESLRWTHGGGVKISGIGIDAALSGVTSDDPARTDTAALGRLLYAALTACWPGPDWPGLPSAPLAADGRPATPRQVRAGVPSSIDDVTCRALYQDGLAGEPAIITPAALMDALTGVMPAPVPPPPAPPGNGHGTGWHDPLGPGPGQGDGYWDDRGAPARRTRPAGSGSRPLSTRMMVSIVAVLAVAAAGFGAWTLGHHSVPAAGPSPAVPPTQPSSSGAASVLTPVSAHGFDALSSRADDPQNENDSMAPKAIDGNPRTAWKTQYYKNSPLFGGLKKGTGLILDMGQSVRLSSVVVTFGPVAGANVRIEIGNSNTRAAATLSAFTTVARATNVGGTHTFVTHSTATGRYVLIWFTKLPPKHRSPHQYMAEIFSIIVRGSH